MPTSGEKKSMALNVYTAKSILLTLESLNSEATSAKNVNLFRRIVLYFTTLFFIINYAVKTTKGKNFYAY